MKEWLDGPRFVEWLEHEGSQTNEAALAYHARHIRRAREGQALSVYSADRILIKLDLHLHHLPDDLWVERPPRSCHPPARVFA